MNGKVSGGKSEKIQNRRENDSENDGENVRENVREKDSENDSEKDSQKTVRKTVTARKTVRHNDRIRASSYPVLCRTVFLLYVMYETCRACGGSVESA